MGSKVEKHLSRLAMPRTWKIKRKGIKWVTRPLPGPHSFDIGLPLNVLLRDMLGYSKTTKEAKNILNNQEILVDGIRRKDHHFIVGLMDVISIPQLDKHFRIILDKKGKLDVVGISADEAKIKPCKIINKIAVGKGNIQLNLEDGKNILVKDGKDYSTGDTVVIDVPSQKIKDVLKMEKSVLIYLIGGTHKGSTGIVEEVKGKKIAYKKEKESFETFKRYSFVIGKDKPAIKLSE